MFGDSRIRTFLESPVVESYDFIPISVGKLVPSQRLPTIKKWIDRTDVLAFGQGIYTFMHSWVRNSAIYGFQKNRPMLSIDSAGINEGWSLEAIIGPSPFLYLMWKKQGRNLTVFNSSYVFDHIWRRRLSVPLNTVRYRLEGDQGLFDEFAPVFRWFPEITARDFSYWIDTAIYLSGKSV